MLPPWLGIVLALTTAVMPAAAQERYRVVRGENFRAEADPQAALLATVAEGSELPGGARQGGWVEVTLEGWIWARSVGPSDRAGFDLRVAGNGENLRVEPNGRVLARLRGGTLLDELGRREGWAHVRRTGWVWRQSLEAVGTPGAPRATPGPAAAARGAAPLRDSVPTLDRVLTGSRTPLLRTPDGDTAGTLVQGTGARVLSRSGEWVRVQFEGWVRETDVRPAGAGVLLGVTGAEVRAAPETFEGQILQWPLQYIALQKADDLRREMAPGTPYLLARGPLPEPGFVYVMLSPDQVRRLEELPALTTLRVVGRVRVGRTRYVGNPILELIDLAVTEP